MNVKVSHIFLFFIWLFGATAPLKSAGVQKINDNLYVGKEDGVYFALERIIKENTDFWLTYDEKQAKLLEKYDKNINYFVGNDLSNSITSFKSPIFAKQMDFPIDVWIGYVSTKKIDKISAEMPLQMEGDIEMSVTVTTDKYAKIYSPLGIFRAVEFFMLPHSKDRHSNLAIKLQSFIAQAIIKIYVDKYYMVTRPLNSLIKIFKQSLVPRYKKQIMWLETTKEIKEISEKTTGIEQKYFVLTSKNGDQKKIPTPDFWKFFKKAPIAAIDIDALANYLKLEDY